MFALEAVNVRPSQIVRSRREYFKIMRGALIRLTFFATNGFPKMKTAGSARGGTRHRPPAA
jgi:hypothetical protein